MHSDLHFPENYYYCFPVSAVFPVYFLPAQAYFPVLLCFPVSQYYPALEFVQTVSVTVQPPHPFPA